MATNHTTNYALNLWEPTDSFLREEFNENTSKIDTAIKAVDAKASQAFSTANLPWVTGTYTGTGALQSAPMAVSLGFRPRLLIIIGNGQYGFAINAGGNSISLSSYYRSPYTYQTPERLALTANGFTVWEYTGSNDTGSYGLCRPDYAYYYFALR